MKKIKKFSAAILAAVMIALCFSSCTDTSKSTQFKEVDGGYGLYRYKGSSLESEYTVPDSHNGKPVTELQAFSIANAEYLEALNIGKNIKSIDPWALTNCPVLERITVSEENPYFCSVDGVLYNKDMTVLLAYPNARTPLQTDSDGGVTGGGAVTLPNTVKEIRDNAFYLCGNLYSIELNEGLEKIGNKAFLKCTNLSAVKLPETLTELGADAFSYCDSLTEVTIPASVNSIGDYAFFSTSPKFEKIAVNRPGADGIQLGESWTPNKMPVEYIG